MSSEGAFRALYFGRRKLLWNSLGRHALFDLETDPREERPLEAADETESAVSALERIVGSLPPPGAPGPATALDEPTRRALESLGYVR
jgi:hypothetical protein